MVRGPDFQATSQSGYRHALLAYSAIALHQSVNAISYTLSLVFTSTSPNYYSQTTGNVHTKITALPSFKGTLESIYTKTITKEFSFSYFVRFVCRISMYLLVGFENHSIHLI